MKRLGKFEIKARKQEYTTAMGLLNAMREHYNKNDMVAMDQFLRSWTTVYSEWIADLDRLEREAK